MHQKFIYTLHGHGRHIIDVSSEGRTLFLPPHTTHTHIGQLGAEHSTVFENTQYSCPQGVQIMDSRVLLHVTGTSDSGGGRGVMDMVHGGKDTTYFSRCDTC